MRDATSIVLIDEALARQCPTGEHSIGQRFREGPDDKAPIQVDSRCLRALHRQPFSRID